MSLYKKISYFRPYEARVTPMGMNGSKLMDGCAFAFDAGAYLNSAKEIGLIIYDENGEGQRIPFSNEGKSGSVYGVCVEDLKPSLDRIIYNFYVDDEIVVDKKAQFYTGNEVFGFPIQDNELKCGFLLEGYDWENDKNPEIPYENSILYGLNTRAFTNDPSSKVKNPGTFEGIVQKLPHIKSLGATAVVLMPSYEFDECEFIKQKDIKPKTIDEARLNAYKDSKIKGKINCWGFTEGYYYAPKNSYSACKFTDASNNKTSTNPVRSFKDMVKEFHKNNLEIIMQFYFTPDVSPSEIVNILRFWAIEYHVDGFRICGFNIPYNSLLKEPALCQTKLWFNYIPGTDLENYKVRGNRYLASDNGNYKNDIRRFLKSDEGFINCFLDYQKKNPAKYAVINYIADYDGFSLNDLYAYDRKHNESNGEENADGTSENFSWNCGIEGETRKKTILSTRKKQIKNAILLLMLSQGTPYIFSGDEFGNTRGGNNNAYCQDNEIGYVNWKQNAWSKDIFEFLKEIISLRMDNMILHMPEELKNLDTLKTGFPDLSYHGFEAWRPDVGFNSRMIGLFFYGPSLGQKDSKSFYVGINMHWENHRLAVPKLKNNKVFKKIIDTSTDIGTSKDNEIPVGERSIVIYEAM